MQKLKSKARITYFPVSNKFRRPCNCFCSIVTVPPSGWWIITFTTIRMTCNKTKKKLWVGKKFSQWGWPTITMHSSGMCSGTLWIGNANIFCFSHHLCIKSVSFSQGHDLPLFFFCFFAPGQTSSFSMLNNGLEWRPKLGKVHFIQWLFLRHGPWLIIGIFYCSKEFRILVHTRITSRSFCNCHSFQHIYNVFVSISKKRYLLNWWRFPTAKLGSFS